MLAVWRKAASFPSGQLKKPAGLIKKRGHFFAADVKLQRVALTHLRGAPITPEHLDA